MKQTPAVSGAALNKDPKTAIAKTWNRVWDVRTSEARVTFPALQIRKAVKPRKRVIPKTIHDSRFLSGLEGSVCRESKWPAKEALMSGATIIWSDMPENLRLPKEKKNKKQLGIKHTHKTEIISFLKTSALEGVAPSVASLLLEAPADPEACLTVEDYQVLDSGVIKPSRLTLFCDSTKRESEMLNQISHHATKLAGRITDLGLKVRGDFSTLLSSTEQLWETFPRLERLRVISKRNGSDNRTELLKLLAEDRLTHLVWSQNEITQNQLNVLAKATLKRQRRFEYLQLSSLTTQTVKYKDLVLDLSLLGDAANNFYAYADLKESKLESYLLLMPDGLEHKWRAGIASNATQWEVEVQQGGRRLRPERGCSLKKIIQDRNCIVGTGWSRIFFDHVNGFTGGYYTPEIFLELSNENW